MSYGLGYRAPNIFSVFLRPICRLTPDPAAPAVAAVHDRERHQHTAGMSQRLTRSSAVGTTAARDSGKTGKKRALYYNAIAVIIKTVFCIPANKADKEQTSKEVILGILCIFIRSRLTLRGRPTVTEPAAPAGQCKERIGGLCQV